jgi:outer membrane protein assembly factor BamB
MRVLILRALGPCSIACFVLTSVDTLHGADRPQWGEAYTRNMVSSEQPLPSDFGPGERDPATGSIKLETTKNVRWVARLGDTTYGTPVVAGGRVFVGTNNGVPRDPRLQGDRGVLMCFAEKTGEFLWQLNLPKLEFIKWADWANIGITSSPTVDGDRAYVVSNRGEVLCLDVQGLANGNDGPFTEEGRLMAAEGQPPGEPTAKDADIVWLFDMPRQVNAQPHNAANCSILIQGDRLYVNTSNGVEWTHSRVIHPEAPSLIVLDKRTGKLLARDEFGIGADVTHGQWSSAALAQVGDQTLGLFGAGNGFLYAFPLLPPGTADETPRPLQPVWKFHGHPLAQTQDHVPPDHQHDSTSYQVTGMPVVDRNRVYVNFTQEPYHRMKLGWLVCVDATQQGSVTRTAKRWSYDALGSSCSTVAIADGLLYATGFDGRLHCLDAETGQAYWVQDLGGPIAASPLVADGKIYVGTDSQKFHILAAGKEAKVLSTVKLRERVSATVMAANGVLYVATWKNLYAIATTPAGGP